MLVIGVSFRKNCEFFAVTLYWYPTILAFESFLDTLIIELHTELMSSCMSFFMEVFHHQSIPWIINLADKLLTIIAEAQTTKIDLLIISTSKKSKKIDTSFIIQVLKSRVSLKRFVLTTKLFAWRTHLVEHLWELMLPLSKP